MISDLRLAALPGRLPEVMVLSVQRWKIPAKGSRRAWSRLLSQFVGPMIIRMAGTEGAENQQVGMGQRREGRLRAAVEFKMTQKVLSRVRHTEEAFNKCCLFSAWSPTPPTERGTERSVSPDLVVYLMLGLVHGTCCVLVSVC